MIPTQQVRVQRRQTGLSGRRGMLLSGDENARHSAKDETEALFALLTAGIERLIQLFGNQDCHIPLPWLLVRGLHQR